MDESPPLDDEHLVHRRLSGPEAVRWSDLNSMLSDIERSRQACERILLLQRQTHVDEDLIEMLWHSALMSYGTSGRSWKSSSPGS